MADTKLVLKCGDIEVQCEGTEEFIKKELPKLIEGIARLRRDVPEHGADRDVGVGVGVRTSIRHDTSKISVSTLAQKLGVKRGSDLVMASALSLTPQGTESFTKKQLRDRCREATTFWRDSYSNNFDNYVANLVKRGSLNHTGGTNYALPLDQRTSLLSRVGGGK